MTISEMKSIKDQFEAAEAAYKQARDQFIKEHGSGVFTDQDTTITVAEQERTTIQWKQMVSDLLPDASTEPYSKTSTITVMNIQTNNQD